MGIPSFYRWLAQKYPRTVVDAKEEKPKVVNGVAVPVDTSLPNPNGLEFDNLYLDMNGIIHPCFHPEDLPAPASYDEVFAAIFKYVDKIFSIVRPRKLLFLSIDGVAPRAKMNQQRSRRFRAAKDAAEQAFLLSEESENILESAEEKSAYLEELRKMDSNVITPGTEFMDLLSSALRYYIHLRLNGDSGWQGIKVIFSDAKVPGEGEHKIISYIRLQRNLPGFDPNTRHCLYGLDADLIMLALATHEIHFSILREGVHKPDINDTTSESTTTNCDLSESRKAHRYRNTRKIIQELKQMAKFSKERDDFISGLNFQFLDIAVLREYLAYDMRIPDSTAEIDLERMIDDFVFMCVFVGNDFLPHIPSLEISEGAIELLMMVYKQEFLQMGGYLTNSFEINMARLEHFVQALGSHECGIFRRRKQVQHEREAYFERLSKRKCIFNTSKSQLHSATKSSHGPGTEVTCQDPQNPRVMETEGSICSISNGTDVVVDKINLGEEGWKERFYAEKFGAKTEDECIRIRRHAVLKYIEGICWVMRYYYEGICSWQWFYPYHYAPFASDFYGLDQLEIRFALGEPFKPFDQLMGVLPAASAHALPLYYRKLMTEASSPLLDFYPNDFELDMNGKRFSWQAICKLPFIEESRLISEIAKIEHTLTDEERERNSLGLDILFMHISHPLAFMVIPFSKWKDDSKLSEGEAKLQIDPKISGGMNGYIYISAKLESPVEICSPVDGMEMIENNKVISVFYQNPSFHPHSPKLPDGVILPRKTVTEQEISHSHVLWHEMGTFGRVFSGRSIPNSVAGAHLAKMAYQLVSKHCIDDRFRRTKDSSIGSSQRHKVEKLESCSIRELQSHDKDPDAEGEEIKTNKKRRKRKKKSEKKKQIGAGIPSNDVQGLEVVQLEKNDACLSVTDGEGIQIEANPKKRKRRSKKKSQSKGDGLHDNDGKLDSCNNINNFGSCCSMEPTNALVDGAVEGDKVPNRNHEKLDCCNCVNNFESCAVTEQINVHADGVLAVKTEVISKKRRRKSKKRRIEAESNLVNSGDKLESYAVKELKVGDGDQVSENKVEETRSQNDIFCKLGSSTFGEQEESKGDHGSSGALEVTEGAISNNNFLKFESSVPLEAKGGDVHNVGASKTRKRRERYKKKKRAELLVGHSTNNKPESGIQNNDVEKLDLCNSGSCTLGVQQHAVDVHAGTTGVVEVTSQVNSKKRKRSKRKIEVDSASNTADKLDHFTIMEQRERGCDKISSDVSEETNRLQSPNNSLEKTVLFPQNKKVVTTSTTKSTIASNVVDKFTLLEKGKMVTLGNSVKVWFSQSANAEDLNGLMRW